MASEIAGLLKLPTHIVRIAECEGRVGCAVRSFLKPGEVLVHGNELMAGAISGYDKEKQQQQSDHHFDNIVATLEHWFKMPQGRVRASGRMVGYLVLDALVGNTDRHHENWGVLARTLRLPESPLKGAPRKNVQITMAPTFDHGSSLGRELLEERAQRLLNDREALRRYIRKATGGIYLDPTQKKGLSPVALVELIAQKYPELFEHWRQRVDELPAGFAKPLLAKIPDSAMSPRSKEFALVFLEETRRLITSIS